MRDLVDVVRVSGGQEPRTYIQSGNVVCRVSPEGLAALRSSVAAELERRFGLVSPVVGRSMDEWSAVLAAPPFHDLEHLHVAFLADRPDPARVARLDPDRSPGDRFVVRGGEIFLHLPNGVARTRITNDWLDRTLGTVATIRNWRTVSALGDLAGSL